MEKYVLDFAPPIIGMDGVFNTFRLGAAWVKRVEGGEVILLVNKARSLVIGRAKVVDIEVGTLTDMAQKHAYRNHNHREYEQTVAAERLIQSMIKRYGPHKCNENSKVTVMYLEIIEYAT